MDEPLAAMMLESTRESFLAQRSLADRAIAQLSEKQLRRQRHPQTNSVAVIMKHVAGNLRSRWTNFLTSDGEKPDRDRDREFVDDYVDRSSMLTDWESGWQVLMAAFESLLAEPTLVASSLTIRGERLSVCQALQRSLAHTAYHVGQIVQGSRELAGDGWTTLTIPRGTSRAFNQRTWGTDSVRPAALGAADDVMSTTDVETAVTRERDAIVYVLEPTLSVQEFADLLRRSTLAERRPVDDVMTLGEMLAHADLLITARCNGTLIGVSRAISDFAFCTYLADLAVDVAYQRQGIGRRLVALTHQVAGHHTSLILLAAPAARSYYPHIGMDRHDSCWVIWRTLRGVTGDTE